MDEKCCDANEGERQSKARTDARCAHNPHEAEKEEEHKWNIEKHEHLHAAWNAKQVPFVPVRGINLVSHQ